MNTIEYLRTEIATLLANAQVARQLKLDELTKEAVEKGKIPPGADCWEARNAGEKERQLASDLAALLSIYELRRALNRMFEAVR